MKITKERLRRIIKEELSRFPVLEAETRWDEQDPEMLDQMMSGDFAANKSGGGEKGGGDEQVQDLEATAQAGGVKQKASDVAKKIARMPALEPYWQRLRDADDVQKAQFLALIAGHIGIQIGDAVTKLRAAQTQIQKKTGAGA